MYPLHPVAVLVLAIVGSGASPSIASTKMEHRHNQTAPVAALLDLQGVQASIGRPAMNGFVLGLEHGSEQGPIPFAALIDTKSEPKATESAARDVVSNVSLAVLRVDEFLS